MACPDLYPSHYSVPSYSSVSRKTSVPESIPQPYTASADPHPPATMTKPLYDQPPAPNDGQFYPVYPESSDFNNTGHSAVAPGDGGARTTAGFSTMGQAEGGYPHGWQYGLGDVEFSFSPSPPGIVQGDEGQALQPQEPWESGAQAYPALMGGTTAVASPTSQYVPAEESMGGCYEPFKWPPPPVKQMSPSPSQSSYYASPPASGSGTQFPRHNSCSSIPAASRARAAEQAPFDVRFRPVPDQAVSPVDGQLSPGGTVANGGLYTVIEPMSSADNQKTRPTRKDTTKNQTITMTTTMTRDYNTGTLSPVVTPSPKETTAAAPNQPVSQSARRNPDQQTQKSTGGKMLLAPWPTAQQLGQGRESRPQPTAQAQAQAQPAQRVRNREAANKCRAKTKEAVAQLESAERAMSAEHQQLSATARGLRDEVLQLKNDLLAHGNCGDSLIQQYLTNQARLVGGGGGVGCSSVPAAHHQHHRTQGRQRPQHHHHHQNQ